MRSFLSTVFGFYGSVAVVIISTLAIMAHLLKDAYGPVDTTEVSLAFSLMAVYCLAAFFLFKLRGWKYRPPFANMFVLAALSILTMLLVGPVSVSRYANTFIGIVSIGVSAISLAWLWVALFVNKWLVDTEEVPPLFPK